MQPQADSTVVVFVAIKSTARLWIDNAHVKSAPLTPGSPLYALNFCERRPSGTRLSAASGASWKRSAVRALSLRRSDDRIGASSVDEGEEEGMCGSMHQLL